MKTLKKDVFGILRQGTNQFGQSTLNKGEMIGEENSVGYNMLGFEGHSKDFTLNEMENHGEL